MKTSDLLLKAKKEGLNKLTLFELRRLSTFAWKNEIFSLNGLVNYCQKTQDEYINHLLQRAGIGKEVITVKWLLEYCNPNELKVKIKNPETDKFELTENKKEKFGMWFVSDTIVRFIAAINAKAQSSNVTKVESKKSTKKEDRKETTKKVKNSKKSNIAA